MKTITVKISKEKNWAGNEYLIYSSEQHGKLAEVDYPIKSDPYRKRPRVYGTEENPVIIEGANGCNFVEFSGVPQALVGAETLCKGILHGRGYETVVFDYPRTIKMK
jgi:hypothetical protein